MTILEALIGRPSRMAVAIEMIVVCIGGTASLTYALARMQLSQPIPLMVGGGVAAIAIGVYVRALRLER